LELVATDASLALIPVSTDPGGIWVVTGRLGFPMFNLILLTARRVPDVVLPSYT